MSVSQRQALKAPHHSRRCDCVLGIDKNDNKLPASARVLAAAAGQLTHTAQTLILSKVQPIIAWIATRTSSEETKSPRSKMRISAHLVGLATCTPSRRGTGVLLRSRIQKRGLKCSAVSCALLYHSECVKYNDVTPSNRATWVCPSCTARKPKYDNSNTPFQGSNRKQQTPDNATVLPPLLGMTSGQNQEVINEIRNLRREMKEHFENQQTCLNKFDAKLIEVQKEEEVDELTKSVQYLSNAYDDQIGLNEESKKILSNLNVVNQNLRSQMTELNSKIDHLEQQARDCNIELQCIPEIKNENILTIIQQMASVVSCELSDSSILNFHRVAKMDTKSQRPRRGGVAIAVSKKIESVRKYEWESVCEDLWIAIKVSHNIFIYFCGVYVPPH
ncbi:unnamed protein product, partial [Leptidea sinapis]